MALSGVIKGTTSNKYIESKIEWSATQSIETNSSTITAILYYERTNSGYSTFGSWSGLISINGISFNLSNSINITDNWVEAGRATATVAHNTDGTKSITILAAGSIKGSTLTSTDCGGTITLNAIPRHASIIAAPNFNDEENPTITYSNPAGTAITSLKACISLTGAADDIAYRNISKTGTTYTFNLTAAERKVLRAATKDAKSRTVRFYIQSTIGGETTLTYLSKTLSIVNATPTLSPTVKDIDEAVLLLTGDENKILKYYSNPSYTVNGAALKEATIKSYKVVCGSDTRTTATGTFYNVETDTIKFTITDSRGNTATKTITKAFIPYIKLTCDITAAMPTTDGVASITVSGNYYNGSFGATDNLLLVDYRVKLNDGDWGEWIRIAPTITDNTYKQVVNLSGLDYQTTYTYQARAYDKVIIIDSATKTVRTQPVFDWGKNDFKFNVNCYFPNQSKTEGNIGIRSYNSEGSDISALVPCTKENVLQLGWGNYNAAIGKTNVYGNEVNIYNNNGLYVNGRQYGVNNVLWAGAYYMTSVHKVDLAEPVSKQPNGIVLVFSRYSGNAAEDSNFNSFFVPKYLVGLHSGAGSCFQMNTVNYGLMAAKYLYIGDTQISGNDLNGENGTATSGVKYDNAAYVLRYVIGV